MQLKKVSLVDLFLFLTIFYHVFISSYWLNLHDSILESAIGFALPGLLGIVSFFTMLKNKKSYQDLLIPGIILIFVVLSVIIVNINMLKFFIICLATVQIDKNRILKTYFYGIGAAVIGVFVLCLLKVLPMINDDAFITYGFRSPNSIGFYLLLLYGIYLILSQSKHWLVNLGLFILLAYVTFLEMEDHTAFLLLFMIYFLDILRPIGQWVVKWPIIKWLMALVPLFFTGITFWIGNNFFNYHWMIRLNKYFTSRPANWNYWMTNFDFSLFGMKIPTDVTFGHGALDGAFFTFPLFNGYLIYLAVLLVLSIGIFNITKNQEYVILVFVLTLLVFSISENGAFKNLYCPLIPLCLDAVVHFSKTYSFRKTEISVLGSN